MMKSRRSFLSLLGIGAAAAPFVGYEAAQALPASAGGVVGLRVPARHLVVVGHDMVGDWPDEHMVCWSDPDTGEWLAHVRNEAGCWRSPYPLTGPAVLMDGGRINIPTVCGTWDMVFQGLPYVYGFFLKNVTAQPMEAI